MSASSSKRAANESDSSTSNSKRSRKDTAVTSSSSSSPASHKSRKKLKFAVVCSSNQNRSMEAHLFMARKGFLVESYGSGNQVKIPGPSIDKPNSYDFGKWTYDEIYNDLVDKDEELYRQNGMLKMVDRNRDIKSAPQRFQDEIEEFDVVVTCEARVFDQVVEGLEAREESSFKPVHVCNVEIKDTHESATLGALHIVDLCDKLEQVEDLDDAIDEVVAKFEENSGESVMHTVAFY
eukprot:m.67753 g.67753  ORF g.67753 m.67753 type:complete len:236 (+) comp23865_c0_seq1:948-1655(+)